MYENLAMVEKRTNSNQKGDVLLKAANFQATTMVCVTFCLPLYFFDKPPSSNFRDIDQNYDWVWSPTVIVKKYQHHEKDNAKYFLGFKHSLMMLMSIRASHFDSNGTLLVCYALFNCKKLMKLTNSLFDSSWLIFEAYFKGVYLP